ncbi:hypothetical protein AV530_015440 [Patagioenas fasciata monilis]|uniref:Beta-enolase n=1 Tax=Patagioenas fasciata monilis TaxID=372326 RepID=A0A1V4IDL3_PATFA|nr:hypothetical protein AV530_015440 [Patagioenas fasciata monilis]
MGRLFRAPSGTTWVSTVVSIEDPFDQDDWEGWRRFLSQVGIQVVGDDLTVTNPKRIQRAAELGACNCLLLKVNQIGSVTESIQAPHNPPNPKSPPSPSPAGGRGEDAPRSKVAPPPGVLKAVEHINKTIAPALLEKKISVVEQEKIDKLMIDMDGTENKSKFGANAILGVSLAVCKAGAAEKGVPLYRHIADLAGNAELILPVPGTPASG